MRIPQTPPSLKEIVAQISDPVEFARLLEVADDSSDYLHWDRLRRHPPPLGRTHREWWLAIKMRRRLKPIPLEDKAHREFQYCVPDLVQAQLHQIDFGAGRSIGVPEPIENPQTRSQYLMRSLIEEAITSSQLEGAATTREVAKEMIRTGRAPRDTSEQMILNNYAAMRRIGELKHEPLTAELVFEIHRLVTAKTLDDPSASGRLRTSAEKRVVCDAQGEIYHDPPPAEELTDRLQAMCEFANGKSPDSFIHPAIRAICLHFWLAYDHPFVDGNGRTARALFYWSMLRSGYWLFEFISISTILRKAPIKYARSFLYTETDDNDLTYFIVAQTRIIRRAIEELHLYIDRRTTEMRELESHLRALDSLNHRQVDLVRHALKHPLDIYTIVKHQRIHNVVYQTARTDLLDLEERGLLTQRPKRKSRRMTFVAPHDLSDRLRKLEKEPIPLKLYMRRPASPS